MSSILAIKQQLLHARAAESTWYVRDKSQSFITTLTYLQATQPGYINKIWSPQRGQSYGTKNTCMGRGVWQWDIGGYGMSYGCLKRKRFWKKCTSFRSPFVVIQTKLPKIPWLLPSKLQAFLKSFSTFFRRSVPMGAARKASHWRLFCTVVPIPPAMARRPTDAIIYTHQIFHLAREFGLFSYT